MRHSLVQEAAQSARRIVVAAITGSIVILVATYLIMLSSQSANRGAAELSRRASEIADTIRVADERRTASVRMAVVTGDAQWIARYRAEAPRIDKAIEAGARIAPSAIADSFDREIRAVNDALLGFESEALSAVRDGQLNLADAIIDNADYAGLKQRLSVVMDSFLSTLAKGTKKELDQVEVNRIMLLLVLMAIALFGSLLLWRQLMALLAKWEGVFAAQETTIQELETNDALTGLPNRRAFTETLQIEVAEAVRQSRPLAVLLIDIDRFKPVNDQYGHHVGDRVLIEISRRISAHLRRGQLAARLGGDEFVIMAAAGSGSELPQSIARRIIDELSRPIEVGGIDIELGASIGYAICPRDATEPAELLRRADVALYRAKADGRGTTRSFDEMMDTELRERHALEADLRKAVAAGEVVPYFQPLVRLDTGRVIGFEILSRWLHPERGMISPAKFIPIAEETGLVEDMTMSVLRQSCLATREWPADLKIAINIAPQQLRDPLLPQRLLAVLTETGFAPRRFEIEITENALVDDLELAKRSLQSLKNVGIGAALDDFGTGYASLSQLSELCFDKIKIDRSFIQTMQEKPASLTIVHAIIGLGHSLGLPTLAEGIESAEVAAQLTALGCTDGQGYHYSKPIPAVEVPRLLASIEARNRAAAAA